MQTFLPCCTFRQCAAVLDNKRLNKQLLEGRQILTILNAGKKVAWSNHPAVLMWKGYEPLLFKYLQAIKDECVKRGIETTKNWNVICSIKPSSDVVIPWWWEHPYKIRLMNTHKYRLKEKSDYYTFSVKSIQPCCVNCKYFWPSHYERHKRNIRSV